MGELSLVVSEVETAKSEVERYFNESKRLSEVESKKMDTGNFDLQYTRYLHNYFTV